MEANFDPHAIEAELYGEWEAAGYFEPSGNGAPFCIMIPPPNVTGSLHMGHAFQHTLMDTLIRVRRMQGDQTLWQMGTDHAGIATQMLVERKLKAEGQDRHEMGRERFIDAVWQWKNESGDNISRQLRRMGSSLDWSRERFTMDEGYARAVQEVFVRLFEDGLIYRGQRLVNWDPELGTAISDLEVENAEEKGFLWHFRYPLVDATTADGKDYLTVATTRPETLLGDAAVAVHPDDERYQALVGRTVRLPLTDRVIPIIADDYVDPEFGTGCVKITPAHDFNDNEVGARHDLPLINVFNADATLTDDVPEAYRGLDRFVARKQMVADLEAQGLLDGIDDHKLMVPRGDRSGAIIEPWLTDQWFVNVGPLAEPAIAAVEDGRTSFVPKQFENTYFAWMRDLKDWCVSRQQWWGHRIPAYYDDAGNVYVARSAEEARSRHGLDPATSLRQDDDVLETWFSSALWTFATLGWPEETDELSRFHPTDVLVTGHDIIFFWVARMMMMTLKFRGEVPFRTVYIHGLVRDADGNKMSKSRGNGLDPIDFMDGISLDALVEKRTSNLMQPQQAPRIEKATRKDFPEGIPAYGTDALRFTFAALASPGRDVRFDTQRVAGYRNFCNKIWNAARFVLTNVQDFDLEGPRSLSLADRWITAELGHAIEKAQRAIDTFRFDLYAAAVYDFAWHEYCDWYVEIVKPLLWDESAGVEQQRGARYTLLSTLETLLRLAHPIIPFVTESLWRNVAPQLERHGETIMVQQFPRAEDCASDPEAVAAIGWLKATVDSVRTIRGEANIKPGQSLNLLLEGSALDRSNAAATEQILKRLAKVATIDWLDAGSEPPPSALGLVGEMKIRVPLKGLIDVDAELARISKEQQKLEKDLARIRGKLNNQGFVAKAPPEVVAKEQDKAADIERSLAALTEQVEELKKLRD
ncbi:MAG: valine--tRNA ligase [Pseudomonadota bacterium]